MPIARKRGSVLNGPGVFGTTGRPAKDSMTMTIESLDREIRTTRAACWRLRRPRSEFEEQRFVRLAERLARLYRFQGWLMAKKYAET